PADDDLFLAPPEGALGQVDELPFVLEQHPAGLAGGGVLADGGVSGGVEATVAGSAVAIGASASAEAGGGSWAASSKARTKAIIGRG
ncbi:MAG: hypothetical protein ACKODL_07775, partial [Phenylobacterium sp.]